MDIVGDKKDQAVAKQTIALQNKADTSSGPPHLDQDLETYSEVTELLTSKDNIWSMVIWELQR